MHFHHFDNIITIWYSQLRVNIRADSELIKAKFFSSEQR